MMFRSTPWPQFFVAETGWVKILIEFGLVGFITYFGFLFYCIFSSHQPLSVRACVAVTPMLSGILDPWSHALMLGLLVWMPPRAEYLSKGDPMRAPHPLDRQEAKRPSVEATATSAPVSPAPRRQPMPSRTRTQVGHGPPLPPGKRLPH
jgi:hypothetical protein